jgi:hypothetical protein
MSRKTDVIFKMPAFETCYCCSGAMSTFLSMLNITTKQAFCMIFASQITV